MIAQNTQDAVTKLRSVIANAQQAFGRDPRGGGFCFCGQADYVAQVLKDLPESMRRLAPALIIGEVDMATGLGSDTVFVFDDVPCIVRAAAKPGMWLIPKEMALPSTRVDRFIASRMRMQAWEGKLIGARA